MARVFSKYPFGNFKLRMGRMYRIMKVKRAGRSSSNEERIPLTDFFRGREFREYEIYFPKEKTEDNVSYQLEKLKYFKGTTIPRIEPKELKGSFIRG